MRYISTSRSSITDMRGAVMHAIAPDGSLYLPEALPVIPNAFFNNIADMTLKEIAYAVVSTLLAGDVSHTIVKGMVDKSFTFPLPMKTLPDGTEVIELFHGPTMAFKDISALFMAEFIEAMHKAASRPFVGVVATTGNTGVAIANAFSSHPDKDMVVMFPRGFLTRLRRNAVMNLGANIHPVEVEGTIGQCKKLIVDAMADQDIAERIMLVNANTKNILRIIPQVAVYFYAYARLRAAGRKADGITVAVPSACLSNVLAAVIAKRMGLPIGKIIAATNSNDDFVRVANGELSVDRVHSTSRPTLAKAMDAGYPTNMLRVMALYDDNLEKMREDIIPVAVSDDEIAATVNDTQNRLGYTADPHTAVALAALKSLEGRLSDGERLVMATAHPSKSLDAMTEITGRAMELPLQMTRFMSTPKGHSQVVRIPPTYPAFRKFLLNIRS